MSHQDIAKTQPFLLSVTNQNYVEEEEEEEGVEQADNMEDDNKGNMSKKLLT